VVDSYKRGKICWWHNGDVGGFWASCGVRGEEAWKKRRLCFSGTHELVKYG
jgi:hypothetical protein